MTDLDGHQIHNGPCVHCGAAVGDYETHKQWHEEEPARLQRLLNHLRSRGSLAL